MVQRDCTVLLVKLHHKLYILSWLIWCYTVSKEISTLFPATNFFDLKMLPDCAFSAANIQVHFRLDFFWKITKHSMLDHHRPASKTPFRKWRFTDRPMMAHLKWYLDPLSPYQLKSCQSWTPSDHLFLDGRRYPQLIPKNGLFEIHVCLANAPLSPPPLDPRMPYTTENWQVSWA